MKCRRGLGLALAVAVGILAAGCSTQDSPEPATGPANSVSGLLPTLEIGGDLPVGEVYSLVVGTHCGVRVIGIVNDTLWIADEATQRGDWMPTKWADAIEDGQELIALEVVIADNNTDLIATAEQISVRYRPVAEGERVPGCA